MAILLGAKLMFSPKFFYYNKPGGGNGDGNPPPIRTSKMNDRKTGPPMTMTSLAGLFSGVGLGNCNKKKKEG